MQAAVDAVVAAGVDRDVVELADRRVVQVIEFLAAIVGRINPAVDAEEHVLAVAGVDPEGVAIGVGIAAQVGREPLASVLRLILRNTQDVDVLIVAGIDSHLTEIHGTRVDAVHASPCFTAVGRAVEAAGLVAIGALARLDVLALAVEHRAERSFERQAPLGVGRLLAERDLKFLGLVAALDLHLHLVVGLLLAEERR